MSAALAAAHVGHQIEHSSALFGFIAGAVVGLAIGIAVVATVATGGAALAVIAAVGGAVAATGGMALAGKYIGEAIKNPSGPIGTGSPNVFYGPGRIPAARAIQDIVGCKNHGPKRIATGSDSVFINTFPAARRTDKTECDGTVGSDLDHLFIGAETAQYLEIESEVPEWMVELAQGMVIVGTAVALVFGAAAAALAGGLCAVVKFGGTVALGYGGALLGGMAGGAIGQALGGELGKRIGEVTGGLLGGIAGARLGNRLATGHPVDVATGELFTTEVDFSIPGLIPLVWERFWISSSTQTGGDLGAKWHHPFDVALARGTDFTLLRMEHGRLVLLPLLEPGETFYHRAEKLTVRRGTSGNYAVRNAEDLIYQLAPAPADPSRCRLTAISDFNGNALTLEYDGDLLHRITTCEGIVVAIARDDLGRISSVSRQAGSHSQTLVVYEYQGDALVSASDASGVPFRYEYASGLIVRETRRSGLSFHFQWDNPALGTAARCVMTWGDGEIYYRKISYQPDAGLTSVSDLNGHVTTYKSNAIGLVTEVTSPLGNVTRTSWNAFGEVSAQIDADGNADHFQHDPFGRLAEATAADGGKTGFVYASEDPSSPLFHSVAHMTDALGAVRRYQYDAAANLAAVTDAAGHTVGFLRNERGLVLAVRDAVGTIARYRWTPEARLAEERTSKGGQRLFDYDPFGRTISETVEGAGTTRFSYDPRDRIVKVSHPDGAQTALAYDVEGNLTSFSDPVGRETHWNYGIFPFPVSRTNPDGSKFSYAYDSELNLVRLRNEVGEIYELTYDAENRLETERGFDGRVQHYGYSPAGFVAFARDGHREHQFKRDPLGRLLRRESSDGDYADYGYDLLGQMTLAANATRKVGFAWDERGLLVKETQDAFALLHRYDQRGERVATVLPDGRQVTFRYDQNGDFDGLDYLGRTILTIRRDRLGRETERAAQGIAQRTDYDPQGRILAQTASRRGGRNPIFARSYSYDASGLISAIRDSARGTRRYQYDAREQLRAVTGDAAESFAFDPAGNILSGAARPEDASVKGGRLLMQGDNHYSYDDAGNRIRAERGWGGIIVTDYAYDAQNQLVLVDETSPSRKKTTRFAYDALGRRVSKTYIERRHIPRAANAIPTPEEEAAPPLRDEVTVFLWNGDVLLSEGTAVTGAVPDPLATVYVYEPNSFRPAAQIRRFSPQDEGRVYLYWLDHLGTPQELTNEAGELVWQVALKAWGGIDRVMVEAVGNNLRFQGQYHDAETGLHYNRFRHYDPGTGAFINQDPIGLIGGFKLFAYPTNPVSSVDPLGLVEPSYTGAGGKGYTVYGLRDTATGKTVYVGQTETARYTSRMAEHTASGRLHGGLEPYRITKTDTFGQARGAEQYHMERLGTRDTGLRGQPMGPGTEGNRSWSYDRSRTDSRARAYKRGYDRERARVSSGGKCAF
jgi:RHS repeat-associated protein